MGLVFFGRSALKHLADGSTDQVDRHAEELVGTDVKARIVFRPKEIQRINWRILGKATHECRRQSIERETPVTPENRENLPPRDVRRRLPFSLMHHLIAQENRAKLGGDVSYKKPADTVAEKTKRDGQ